MRFGYGTFRFEDGEASLRTFNRAVTYAQNGFAERIAVTLDIDFEIVRDGQAAIQARFDQIAAAFNRNGKDVGFYLDSGVPSRIFIKNSDTTSGVKITQLPSIEADDGADYATHLKGSCGFMAEYYPATLGLPSGGQTGQNGQTTGYRETVSVRGTGGPRVAIDVTDRGLPKRFILADRTPVFAQQSGSLEVLSESPYYPAPNPPLWPALVDPEQTEVTRDLAPSDDGSYRSSVSWTYQFQSPGPLTGVPKNR